MTNENIIEIKKQNKNWFLNGFIYLFMMISSLFIALLPIINEFAKSNELTFVFVGIIVFLISAILYAINIFTVLKPKNAIVLSAHGFIDCINVGDGIEIEWTNVSAVKMLGKSNMPFLGVTLENTDLILSKMSKNLATEMRENIDQNLPTILIPQSKVKAPIKELKDTFAKFAREARALEKESQQKQKNNPFTTDDVLRAFGKLPKEEEVIDTNQDDEELGILTENNDIPIDDNLNYQSNEMNVPCMTETEAEIEEIEDDNLDDSVEGDDLSNGIIEPTVDVDLTYNYNIANNAEIGITDAKDYEIKYVSPFEIPNEIGDENSTSGSGKQSASDHFYEELRQKAILKNDDSVSNSSNSNDTRVTKDASDSADQNEEMPDEIKDILSRAKSSRISQIEKLLNESDIPFSLSRENNNSLNTAEEQIVSNTPVEVDINIALDELDDGTDSALDSDIILPSNLKDVFVQESTDADGDNIEFDLSFVSGEDPKPEDTSSLDNIIQRELASTDFSNNLNDTKEFIFDK